jgi:DNA-binding beta-propeller fold protein YncE
MKNISQIKPQKLLFICSVISLLLLFQSCEKDESADSKLDTNLDSKLDSNLVGSWKITEDGSKAPWGIAIDSEGNVYFSELYGNGISKFTSAGTLVTHWGTNGSGNGQFNMPKHIAIDGEGNVYVADEENQRIQKFTSSGAYITQWGNPDSGVDMWAPGSVTADIVNNWVYVVDVYNRLQKFDLSGNFITQWGGTGTGDGQLMLGNQSDPFNQSPCGQMAVDTIGNVYVVDNHNSRIQKFTSSGTFLMKWGGKGSEGGQFMYPFGIVIDNKNGFIYVSDNSLLDNEGNIARIEKFDLSGNFIKQWVLNVQNQAIGALAVDHEGHVLAVVGGNLCIYDFN